jgi:transposase
LHEKKGGLYGVAPKQIDLSPEQANALIEHVKSRTLDEKDCEILIAILQTVLLLYQTLSEKSHSIQRLLRRIFGVKTESAKNLLKDSSDKPSPGTESPESTEAAPKEEKSRKRGHGRNGADRYQGLHRIQVPHQSLKNADPCLLCPKGKVYRLATPKTLIRLTGHPPVGGDLFELERLRCNLCGAIFTANAPEGVGDEKYDEAAGAMICLLKYGAGLPFYRLEKLQEALSVPLPASTQWDIAEGVADKIHPVFAELIREGAQGDIVQNDDTTMRVISLMQEIAGEEEGSRTGIFTTGVLSTTFEGRKIALFFTGRKHAGENLEEVLQNRAPHLSIPIQMCDALDRNIPKKLKTILCNCLTHARRNFVDVLRSFPEECQHLIETLAKVYHNDAIAKEKGMGPQERLEFHQVHSGPVMEELKGWAMDQFNQKKVEPNSSLGRAIEYMVKRWEKFTRFLHIAGAPLDNNLCEQILKRSVLHRKNSLFYRTEHGAYIGDLFMSLITTCSFCGVNPFDYLIALQKHSSELFKDPKRWMPWNYTEAMHPPPS